MCCSAHTVCPLLWYAQSDRARLNRGYILDGWPRTAGQAKWAFMKVCVWRGSQAVISSKSYNFTMRNHASSSLKLKPNSLGSRMSHKVTSGSVLHSHAQMHPRCLASAVSCAGVLQVEPMSAEEKADKEKDEAYARAQSPSKGGKGGAGDQRGRVTPGEGQVVNGR